MGRLLSGTFNQFVADECPRYAAALAYYALFSLPALLVLVVTVADVFVEREDVEGQVQHFLGQVMGERSAEQLASLLKAHRDSGGQWWSPIVSIGLLLVGATGVLAEVQAALNRIWGVQPDPKASWTAFFWKRLISVGLVIGIALLVVASLVISWLTAEFSAMAESQVPGWISPGLLGVVDQLVSLGILTLLCAAVFKFLPDAKLQWTNVWAGAIMTALLFVVGKIAISVYLAWSDPTTAFGAAGSVALLLVWLYYSGMIFFLGAEFTHAYSQARGQRVQPEANAVDTHKAHAV